MSDTRKQNEVSPLGSTSLFNPTRTRTGSGHTRGENGTTPTSNSANLLGSRSAWLMWTQRGSNSRPNRLSAQPIQGRSTNKERLAHRHAYFHRPPGSESWRTAHHASNQTVSLRAGCEPGRIGQAANLSSGADDANAIARSSFVTHRAVAEQLADESGTRNAESAATTAMGRDTSDWLSLSRETTAGWCCSSCRCNASGPAMEGIH